MASFGITSTTILAPYASLNARRKIFYQFPTGAAPLMGLLSMLPTEDTDKDTFGWWEQRFPVQRTLTVATGTAPFTNGDNTAFADLATMTADVEYRVKVVSTAEFRATHVIEIRGVTINDVTTTTYTITGTVTVINSTTQLTFRPDATLATVDNGTTDNNGLYVAIIGTANPQGGRSIGSGINTFPVKIENYTQIFRTPVSLTRTALKMGLVYDKSGPYKKKVKDNGLRHMIEQEKAFLWGNKHQVMVTDPTTGDSEPENKMGGIRYFLQQYEAADSVYRGGTGAPAITLNTDPDKRIIDVGGTMSGSAYRGYMSRLFRKTNDSAYEKLCLCGGTFLETINSLFEKDIVRQTAIQDKTRNWEFMVHSHTTLRGTVHYKVHPLLDEDPQWQSTGFFLDMGNLHYRPLSGSDTQFLKGRQETDRDGRKDEWITECGMELQFPESHMIIQNASAPA